MCGSSSTIASSRSVALGDHGRESGLAFVAAGAIAVIRAEPKHVAQDLAGGRDDLGRAHLALDDPREHRVGLMAMPVAQRACQLVVGAIAGELVGLGVERRRLRLAERDERGTRGAVNRRMLADVVRAATDIEMPRDRVARRRELE